MYPSEISRLKDKIKKSFKFITGVLISENRLEIINLEHALFQVRVNLVLTYISL